MTAHIGELNRKSAPVAKAVEGSTTRVFSGCSVIVALIQVPPGLLTGKQRNLHLPAVFIKDNRVRGWVADRVSFEGQTLQLSDLAIIAKDYRSRLITFLKKGSK